MFIERLDVALTVDASGNATIFTTNPVAGGFIRQVRYVPDGTNPLATGAVVVLTGDVSGLPILTITGIGTVAANWAPRQATHSVAGAAALYAAAGLAVDDLIAINGERIKIAVSGGGVSKTGTLSIWLG
jgi:hypothetical protein